MFLITPKQTVEELRVCAEAGLTPLLTSSPGMGKSSLVHAFAEEFGLKLIDLRLSQCTPEDLQGFPMRSGNKATFTPFDVFPIEGDPIPEGYTGWLLFLDELTSASKPVQAAAYKLILDRMTGSFKLHPNVVIVAAGNKATDKAVVNQMSTALQSRIIHYELELNVNDWIELAHKQDFDHRVIGYITYQPGQLMDFRPDHQDKTFPCPRTWDFLSRLVKDREVSTKIGARIAGTVGQGAAVGFITFAEQYDKLPRMDAILADPLGIAVPREASTRHATISMLISEADEDNLGKVMEYVDRFDAEFQFVFCRGANLRNPKLRHQNKAFDAHLMKMLRYLS